MFEKLKNLLSGEEKQQEPTELDLTIDEIVPKIKENNKEKLNKLEDGSDKNLRELIDSVKELKKNLKDLDQANFEGSTMINDVKENFCQERENILDNLIDSKPNETDYENLNQFKKDLNVAINNFSMLNQKEEFMIDKFSEKRKAVFSKLNEIKEKRDKIDQKLNQDYSFVQQLNQIEENIEKYERTKEKIERKENQLKQLKENKEQLKEEIDKKEKELKKIKNSNREKELEALEEKLDGLKSKQKNLKTKSNHILARIKRVLKKFEYQVDSGNIKLETDHERKKKKNKKTKKEILEGLLNKKIFSEGYKANMINELLDKVRESLENSAIEVKDKNKKKFLKLCGEQKDKLSSIKKEFKELKKEIEEVKSKKNSEKYQEFKKEKKKLKSKKKQLKSNLKDLKDKIKDKKRKINELKEKKSQIKSKTIRKVNSERLLGKNKIIST